MCCRRRRAKLERIEAAVAVLCKEEKRRRIWPLQEPS